MFTGITEEVGVVTRTQPGGLTFSAREVIKGTQLGGSIAVNGVCLTVTRLDHDALSLDIMPETLKRTNLGLLRVGSEVNLERPLTLDKPLGGHLVQGHIDGTGRVASVTAQGEATVIRFEAPGEILRYVVEQGFIAVDGVSLTVVAADASSFQVSLVGYTLRHTTLGKKRVGDTVNLEVDIIAKYVERMGQGHRSGITAEFLAEHGFSAD
jgi:riboflavin synthase